MREKRLDCCIVRDLLPMYIEGLTEEQTTGQVLEHLEHCPECKAKECSMRMQVPIPPAPKGKLKFLKRVKRTRLIAAALTVVCVLLALILVYCDEFSYHNTEAGRIQAVADYIESNEHLDVAVRDIQIQAVQERGEKLFFSFTVNGGELQGAYCMEKGLVGRCRMLSLNMGPSEYTAGITINPLGDPRNDEYYTVFCGRDCREIYAYQIDYEIEQYGQAEQVQKIYPINSLDFISVATQSELQEEVGIEAEQEWPEWEDIWVDCADVRFLDKNGKDITQQYRDASVTDNWLVGTNNGETGRVYWTMSAIALTGALILIYFLRKQ